MERERERDIVFYACWWDNNDADLYKKIEREERKNATPFEKVLRFNAPARCVYDQLLKQ